MSVLTLLDTLVTASLPVVGAQCTTSEGRAAHVAAHAPVLWLPIGTGFVRLDLTRSLDAEEQVEAAGIIAAWAEDL